MKKIIYTACGLLLIMAGCTKTNITQQGDIVNGAKIKLIHAAPGVPAVNGFINGTKVSATTVYSVTDNEIVTAITTGFSYLSVFPGLNYLSVPAGSTAIKFTAATSAPVLKSPQTVAPETVIGEATQSTADGSAYSAFLMGLPGGNAADGLTVKVVEDKFPAPIANKAFVRFAHMVPNGGAVDLTATYTLANGTVVTQQTVITNTNYGTVTDFVPVDVNPTSTTNYKFQMTLNGTAITFGTITPDIPLAPGRYYTIVGRGLAADYAVPGTSILLKASARPKLPTTDPATRLPEIYFNAPGITFYTNK
ncbi:DUF4397 domain-containing protein [Mucilaginibacter terrigena]|uniref:DUF4397 domain-containing protein n=1 Tax=Mucilaginibacter terrigena TaxID=2492395 RepID=A0A4Q5LRL8_9SPHI|nr:DUF4397 domain-containing protein [Mucilaginibacter terrigena]RYU92152.1 DUF4397 domain-containing protein [Mucilaginibacter terrigena]